MLRPQAGGSEIIDTSRHGRVVALVHDSREAVAILAYLNGHMEIASRLHGELTEPLAKVGSARQ